MRVSPLSLLLLYMSFSFAPPAARGVERTSIATPTDADSWTTGTTVDVSYYNTCTGWRWIWGWDHGTNLQLGVCYDAPANHSLLVETGLFQYSWIPNPSYGYSATVDVFSADAEGCPVGPALASQPYQADVPGQQAWVQYSWNVMVPSRFVLAVTFSTDSPYQNGPNFFTDHPAAGPTGPAACGFCFPSDRVGHSFLWQDDTGAHCPGVPMNDFVCDAELMWYVRFQSTVSMTNCGWGRLKTRYR